MTDRLFVDARRFAVPTGSVRWIPTAGSRLDRVAEDIEGRSLLDLLGLRLGRRPLGRRRTPAGAGLMSESYLVPAEDERRA